MIGAFAFLTVFGRGREPGRFDFAWFPVVGLAVGAATAGVFFAGRAWLGPLIGAAGAVAARLALTGGLHVDALGDAADGLLAVASPERRLEIMADSRTGNYGVAAIALALGVQVNARGAVGTTLTSLVLIAVPDVVARWTMTVGTLAPYARPGGLAAPFLEGGRAPLVAATAATAVLVAAAATVTRDALVVAGGATAAATAVHILARRRIGGFTGDTLGAAGEVAATVGLLLGARH